MNHALIDSLDYPHETIGAAGFSVWFAGVSNRHGRLSTDRAWQYLPIGLEG